MNTDIIKGNWHQLKGKIIQKWAKLTNNEVEEMEGTREELQGILQKRYGYEKDKAATEIDNFVKDLKLNEEKK